VKIGAIVSSISSVIIAGLLLHDHLTKPKLPPKEGPSKEVSPIHVNLVHIGIKQQKTPKNLDIKHPEPYECPAQKPPSDK
jgi:hypothetical protein